VNDPLPLVTVETPVVETTVTLVVVFLVAFPENSLYD
jgi:hypothetical protein